MAIEDRVTQNLCVNQGTIYLSFCSLSLAPHFLQKWERGPLLAPSHFKMGRHLKIIGKQGPLQAPSRFKTGQNNRLRNSNFTVSNVLSQMVYLLTQNNVTYTTFVKTM